MRRMRVVTFLRLLALRLQLMSSFHMSLEHVAVCFMEATLLQSLYGWHEGWRGGDSLPSLKGIVSHLKSING